MIKIINEIEGKKYKLVKSHKGCIECDLERMCYGVDKKLNVIWEESLPCKKLSGVWKEVNEKFNNCRVCNTNHDLQVEVHDSSYTVCCTNCLMNGTGFVRGPYCMTEEEAIEEWNKLMKGD